MMEYHAAMKRYRNIFDIYSHGIVGKSYKWHVQFDPIFKKIYKCTEESGRPYSVFLNYSGSLWMAKL